MIAINDHFAIIFFDVKVMKSKVGLWNAII